MKLLVALVLLEFTGPAGGRVDINANEISSIRDPAKIGGGTHFAPGAGCVLVLTNGHAVPVRETCDKVREEARGLTHETGPCILVCGQAPSPH